jgi:ADP-heptose:LPS heptosyltransferase
VNTAGPVTPAGRPHVLVVRADNIGDVLLAGPAVRAVAAGAGRVTFLAGPRGRVAAELLPGVDEVLTADLSWIDPDPAPVGRASVLALADRLAERRIDQAVILTSFHQSPLPTALVLRMAGVPVVAAVSEDYPGSLLDVRHRVPDDIHEVERALSTVATLGYWLPAGDAGDLEVRLPPPGRAQSVPRFGPGAAPVVVHPGASVLARTWTPERWAGLVDALVDAGRAVIVTGGRGETDLTSFVAGCPRPGVTDLGGRLDLPGLGRVLAGAEAVVVGNTGPAHLAAAVGTPVVSLYAPTVPAVRWHPWHVPYAVLGRQDIACAGCRARACPVPGHPCLAGVSAAEVVAAVDSLTGAGPIRGRGAPPAVLGAVAG